MIPDNISAQITVRPATQQDVATLTQLARETYADAFGPAMTAGDLAAELAANLNAQKVEMYITGDVVLVAEFEGRMIGFTHISAINMPVDTPAEESRQLRRLYVHRDFQNYGVGTLLMAAALAHPLLSGGKYVYLDVWSLNMGAQRFYQRHGFAIVDERPYIRPSGELGDPDYIMMRRHP